MANTDNIFGTLTMTEIIDDDGILDSGLPEDVKKHWELGYKEGYEHGFEDGQKDIVENSDPWLAEDLGDNEDVSNFDPKTIAIAMLNEDPHLASIILAFIEPSLAAFVLLELSVNIRPNLISRLGKMKGMSAVAIQKLNSSLPFKLPVPNEPKVEIDGIVKAASILSFLQRTDEDKIMEKIAFFDYKIAREINCRRLYFKKIEYLGDEDIQTLLPEIVQEDLLISLKNVGDSLKEKIYDNMTDRSSALLKKDLEGLGPIALNSVEAAQDRIVAIVAKLEEEGRILINETEEDYV
jgi:flagellar motor switch protein FliG